MLLNAATHTFLIQGPCGDLEVALDLPTQVQEPFKTAVIAHPHPVYGGNMHHKVVQTLARSFVQAGWRAVRFNARGVGKSQGSYDAGIGEVQDWLAVFRHFITSPHDIWAAAGFSFGAFVTAKALSAFSNTSQSLPAHVILVGTATSRFEVPPLLPLLHPRSLVLHGQEDEIVPVDTVLHWARPQTLPVTLVPGVGHFFHGQLPLLKSLVLRQLQQKQNESLGFFSTSVIQ